MKSLHISIFPEAISVAPYSTVLNNLLLVLRFDDTTSVFLTPAQAEEVALALTNYPKEKAA